MIFTVDRYDEALVALRDAGHGLVALSTERTERALELVKDVLIS